MQNLKKTKIKGQTLLRQRNVVVVMNKINVDGPITKRDVVNSTGISFAKVNSITSVLNKVGLIIENGKEESNGGRRSSLYEVNPNFRYTIGTQLSHTRIQTIVANLKGNILHEISIPFDKEQGKEAVINLMVDSIEKMINESKIPIDKFLGIGVAIAGLFNPNDGTALPFPHLVKWGNVSFKEIFAEKFRLPCYVNNVANAAALAELKFGLGKGKNSLLYLNIGSGLGMGVIINGTLFEGVTGSAGEFGHISVDDHGPLCKCGNLGCLEAIASTLAIEKQAKKLLNQGVASSLLSMVNDDIEKIDFDKICQAAKESDKLAYNLIDKMGQNLGEGIVTVINLFNPAQIIIGGKVVCASDLISNSISTIVQKRALEIPRRITEIVFSKMGNYTGTIGATVPILEQFFNEKINMWIEEK